MTPERFVELYEPCAGPLVGLARKLTRGRDTADDLVQETLLKAWMARHRYAEGTNFRAWLCTILRNTWLDAKRTQKSHPSLERLLAAGFDIGRPASQDSELEWRGAVQALRRLGPAHREAIRLSLYELTYDQCAAILGLRSGTVRSRLSRARACLRERTGRE